MRAFCIITLVLLVACNDTKPAEPGNCYRPQDNQCIEYGAAQAAAGKRLCVGMQWNAGSCASANRLGICTQSSGKQYFYSGAPNNYSAESAMGACKHAGGTWAAP